MCWHPGPTRLVIMRQVKLGGAGLGGEHFIGVVIRDDGTPAPPTEPSERRGLPRFSPSTFSLECRVVFVVFIIPFAVSLSGRSKWVLASDIAAFIFAKSLKRRMPELTIVRPLRKLNLCDQRWFHPRDIAGLPGSSGEIGKRRLGLNKLEQLLMEQHKRLFIESRADAAGVPQFVIAVKIAQG